MGKDEDAAQALENLCQSYRVPLYCLAREKGFSSPDAEELAHDFLVDSIRRKLLHQADRSKGRLRSYLRATFNNFLANEWDRRRAAKRGGRTEFVSLEELDGAEGVYREARETTAAPEKIYDKLWAMASLRRALERLKTEYQSEGRSPVFRELEPILANDGRAFSYRESAQRLAMTEEALRMAASRMRRRFGELLRKEVARTVSEASEADEELRYLFSCL